MHLYYYLICHFFEVLRKEESKPNLIFFLQFLQLVIQLYTPNRNFSDLRLSDDYLELNAENENFWANKNIPFSEKLRVLLKDRNELRYNKDFMIWAVRQDGGALKYASPRLQFDEEFVKAAVTNNGLALEYVSQRLQLDKEIVKAAVTNNGLALKFASDALKDDKEIVKLAVAQNGLALEFASDELGDDREIVKAAVTNNGLALQFASYELRNHPYEDDIEIIKLAVAQNGLALKYVVPTLKDDEEIVKLAVAQNGLALKYASQRLQFDEAFVKATVTNNGLALEYVVPMLKYNEEIVKAAVTNNGLALEFASYCLRADEEIVAIAWKQNPDSIRWSRCPTVALKLLLDDYENNQATVEYTVANIVAFTKKDIFKTHLDILSYLVKGRFNNNACFDGLAKKVCAALDIDVTIENMFKLLPQEDFSIFEYIYNIHLRELFNNHEVYPGDQDKITEYATDYLDTFPRCFALCEMAFHVLNGYTGMPLTKKAHKKMLGTAKHPFKERKINESDLVVLGDQKLKDCSQALIYGFKMHTLDVLYKEDPTSPLIPILLKTFNKEEKTKSEFQVFQEKLNTSSTMPVSMFADEIVAAAGSNAETTTANCS